MIIIHQGFDSHLSHGYENQTYAKYKYDRQFSKRNLRVIHHINTILCDNGYLIIKTK